MKPVDQTLIGIDATDVDAYGNCFPSCIASILELPLDQVPHFYQEAARAGIDREEVGAGIMQWFASRGLFVVTYDYPVSRAVYASLIGVPLIFSGTSLRATKECPAMHAVVGTFDIDGKYQLLHDPHPSHDGLDGRPAFFEIILSLKVTP